MSEPDRLSDPTAAAMGWLAGEPADDPVADLAALREWFGRVSQADADAPQRQEVLDAFSARALDICGRFGPRLISASLPLAREMHLAAASLVDALLEIAAACQRQAEDGRGRWRLVSGGDPLEAAAQAQLLVGEAYLIGCMAGAVAPSGLWLHAHALMAGVSSADLLADSGAAARLTAQYKRLLAIAVAQPESLTARELAWLFDYLGDFSVPAELSLSSLLPEQMSYWMDCAQDGPPVAAARRQAPEGVRVLHFTPVPLVRMVDQQMTWLESRILEAEVVGLERDGELLAPDVSGLPEGLTPVEALTLLRRLRGRWTLPPMRELPRRKHQYTVQVCTGLRAIWEMARRGEENVTLAEWLVFNESPGGYAIMCVAGVEGVLSAGMALALRRDASQPWSICIVRWLRSENPDQVELGLQLLSQAFTPVSVGFRGSDIRGTAPALILPPMAAVRRNQAILAPAGSYVSRRFILVHESSHLYIAQARVLGLDMQTAAVELFQYEIDPYPI